MQQEVEQRLKSFTRDDASNWVKIGLLLLDLEAQSRADPEGRAWQDVVRNRLEELDAPISSGHIYKIRRAIGFLIQHAPDATTPENSSQPKISAIEVAERLYRLDPDAGKKALLDVVGPNPVTYVELQKRYSNALKENPEMKSPRQIAWESRRKADKTLVSENTAPSPSSLNTPKGKMAAPSDQTLGPSKTLRQEHEELLSKVWAEGQHAAEQKYASEISGLHKTIEAQAEEIAISVQAIHDLEGEIAVLSAQIKELRGYYPEDFD